MALISDLANAIPTKSDIIEIQRGQTSSNNASVEQLMQLSAVENLADSYDSTSTYSVGDWCVYEGTLHQCNTAITTAEAFDSTKWDAKKVVDMTASDIPMSSSDSTTVAEAIGEITPKVAILTSSMNCSYADSSTIGYRATSSDTVNLTTLPNYPTGHTILGFAVAYAYVGSEGEYYHIAQLNIVGTNVYCNAKISGIVRFAIRVIYI